jgi:hypothetical protein
VRTLSRFENAPDHKELLRMTEALADSVIDHEGKLRLRAAAICLPGKAEASAATWCKLCLQPRFRTVENRAPESHLDMETRRTSKFLQLQALFINLWIAIVVLLFVAIRILGSNTARRIFHSLVAR